VLAGLVSSESYKKESVPCLFLVSGDLLAIFNVRWLVDKSLGSLPSCLCGILLVCMCVFFLHIRTQNRAHRNRAYPNDIIVICSSAKTIFSSKVIVCDTRG
jgi:F0F1-type ATP synthase assembly protein I